MTFGEMTLACQTADDTLESTLVKCKAFAEASYNEYKTNLKEANLKVVQESGTPDDLVYLEAQASEGFLVKSAKTIEKIIQSFIQFLKDKIDAVKKFFTDKKTKETLDRADKVIKANPKLKNKKVPVTDYDKTAQTYDRLEAKVDRKLAVFKAKKFRDSDAQDLDEIEDEFNKEKAAKRAITVAVVATSLAVLGKGYYDKYVKEKPIEEKAETLTKTTDRPEDMENVTHAVQLKAMIRRARLSSLEKAMKDCFNGLKSVITGSGQVEPSLTADKKDEPKTESVTTPETYRELDDTIQENYINDILSSFDEEIHGVTAPEVHVEESAVEKRSFTSELNDIFESQESTEETADTAVESYLESVVEEIFGEGNYVEEKAGVDPEGYLSYLESTLFEESTDDDAIDPEAYLEALESAILSDDTTETPDDAKAYLESLEAELFGEGTTDEEQVTTEEYLESMEAELFSEDDETVVEESAEDARLSSMLDDIIASIE